jgi:hypothetical protein
MKKNKRRLPLPQHEFGFSPDTFNLFAEVSLDGDRIARERAEADQARLAAEAAQAALFTNKKTTMNNSSRLHAGDVVAYAGQSCPVVRVNDCAAVIAVAQKPRTITPRFGKPVTIQPAPKHAWISAQSEIPILNR